MLELAKKVLALTGSDARSSTARCPSDDPVRRKPDISRARELLGWEPTVPLDEGLERTVELLPPLPARPRPDRHRPPAPHPSPRPPLAPAPPRRPRRRFRPAAPPLPPGRPRLQ